MKTENVRKVFTLSNTNELNVLKLCKWLVASSQAVPVAIAPVFRSSYVNSEKVLMNPFRHILTHLLLRAY